MKDVEEFYQNIPVPMDIMAALDELEDKDAVSIHADDTIDTTRFGRAVAMSFLSVDDGVIIKDSINDPKYLSYYYNKPFFKTNLKELRLLSEKIDESNENALKKNKKIKIRKRLKKRIKRTIRRKTSLKKIRRTRISLINLKRIRLRKNLLNLRKINLMSLKITKALELSSLLKRIRMKSQFLKRRLKRNPKPANI